MGNWRAKLALGPRAVNRVTFPGEEDRMRHRRSVEFVGEMVRLHPESAEGSVRRLVRRVAGRDRPVVALDAVDRDGHHLIVLVDGDGDFGLGGAGGRKQHKAREGNEVGTHVNSGLRPLTVAPPSPSQLLYARNSAFVPAV